MKIYIIRHGETNWNKERRLQGQIDIALNDYGRELARITAEGLKDVNFDYIFSSPLIRAYETAEILRMDRPLDIVQDDRLKEVNFGKYEGTVLEERDGDFANFFDAPELYVPDGGAEAYDEILKRAKSFLDECVLSLLDTNPDANVLISGHGAINRGLMAVLRNIPVRDYWKGVWQRNCCLNLFEVTSESTALLEEGKIFYNADPNSQASYVTKDK